MQEFYHYVKDPVGIHVRPTGGFVKRALQFDSEVELVCNGKSVNGKSLFSILSLDARTGDELCVRIRGNDEKEAAKVLLQYIQNA